MEIASFSKLLSVLGILAGSLFPALHPFAVPEGAKPIPGLEGSFHPPRPADATGAPQESLVFAPNAFEDFFSYNLQVVMAGEASEFIAVPFRLKRKGRSTEFLDLVPRYAGAGNSFFQRHVLLAHTVVKVEREEGELRLSTLDPAWLKRRTGEGETALTGSTKDLRALLAAALSEGGFTRPVKLYRN